MLAEKKAKLEAEKKAKREAELKAKRDNSLIEILKTKKANRL